MSCIGRRTWETAGLTGETEAERAEIQRRIGVARRKRLRDIRLGLLRPYCDDHRRWDGNGRNFGSARPVACVETGRVFASAYDAARWLGMDAMSGIGNAIRGGGTCGGYHWRHADTWDGGA